MKILVLILMLSNLAWSQENSTPVGFYSKGSILNSWELTPEGDGYMRLFLLRDRGYGSRELVTMIAGAGADMHKISAGRDRLQVGDLGALNGGVISRHGSHQNGLDVDLTYYRVNGIEQNQNQINGFAEVFVKNKKLSKNFDIERNWELLKALHRHGKVQRIFVDEVIKKELCRFAKKSRDLDSNVEVLRSLRPYPNHADHMHVRLACPVNTPECVPQEETPVGAGC